LCSAFVVTIPSSLGIERDVTIQKCAILAATAMSIERAAALRTVSESLTSAQSELASAKVAGGQTWWSERSGNLMPLTGAAMEILAATVL